MKKVDLAAGARTDWSTLIKNLRSGRTCSCTDPVNMKGGETKRANSKTKSRARLHIKINFPPLNVQEDTIFVSEKS